MKIVKFAVEHATAAFVLLFVLTIAGLGAYASLPRESAPEIAIPIVIVSTPYFGVSPSDIETLVTQKMEKEFKGIRDLKEMTSTSAESVSLITLEFETDIDIEQALQKVRDKIDKVKPDLPADAEESEITEINSSDWPVLIANVSGDLDPVRLKEIGESMQDDLEEITGVLRVDLAGGVEREIQVDVDPLMLRRYDVSADDVIGAIRGENLDLPGGSIEIGSLKYLVRVPGEYKDPRLLGEIVVKAPEGQTILVKDVAEVKDGYKERETYSRLTTVDRSGEGPPRLITRPNISLSVVKRAGENIIDVGGQVARGDRRVPGARELEPQHRDHQRRLGRDARLGLGSREQHHLRDDPRDRGALLLYGGRAQRDHGRDLDPALDALVVYRDQRDGLHAEFRRAL